jgi:hypothetical protein
MSTVQVVRVGQKSPTTVVRVESRSGTATVVPVATGSGSGSGERWWQGEGPPPDLIVGSRVGDWYWDTISGNVYELTEGV